jgi:hypothetical protein
VQIIKQPFTVHGAFDPLQLALTWLGRQNNCIATAVRRGSKVTFTKLGQIGEFGNQLFQISAVLGYATTYGCRVVLPPWRCVHADRNYDEIFPQFKNFYGKCHGTLYEEPSFAFQRLPFVFNVDLRGWFQSDKYFCHIKSTIQKLFQESPSIAQALNLYCNENRLEEFDAVHIRCYSRAQDIGAEMLPWAYFKAALDRIESEQVLVVASDERGLAKHILSSMECRRPLHILSFEDPLLDFFMLTRARRIVISNSSFSWWASYLGGKKIKILAPDRRHWISKNNRDKPFFNTKDLYTSSFEEVLLS